MVGSEVQTDCHRGPSRPVTVSGFYYLSFKNSIYCFMKGCRAHDSQSRSQCFVRPLFSNAVHVLTSCRNSELVWTQILQGAGGGLAALASQVGAQASVPHLDVAMVIATILLITEIGGAIGAAVCA